MKFLRFLRKNHARQKLERFLLDHRTAKKTLDIGCRNSPYIHLFPNRVGVDITPCPGVDVICSVYSLPFENSSFECVLCTEVLEHLNEPQRAINEIFRVLTPSGKLILTTRFLYPRHGEPNDFFRYTPDGIRYLLRNFEIESIQPETAGLQTFTILFESYVFERNPAGFRWGRVGRILILFAAWLFWQISGKGSRRIDERSLEPISNALASGYYVIAFKKKI